MGCYEGAYEAVLAALEEDPDNPFGPTHGRYRLELRYSDEFFPGATWETPPNEALDAVAAFLEELEADIVTVWPELAQWLGRRGLLLPLNQFSGADDESLEREYFPVALDRYRADGALYALPVSAAPLMLYYHASHFRRQGALPPDASWDWDDLTENGVELTTYRDGGGVARWGLIAHSEEVWWALWQNDAEAVNPDTVSCRLQEPEAAASMQFIHDLIHKHGASPAAWGVELFDILNATPPAMQYDYASHWLDPAIYRMAALPSGKQLVVPVRDGFGIGITTRTPRTEASYTAMQGLVRAMQTQVMMPARREAIAGLRRSHYDLQPAELKAVERSLEYGRALPQTDLPKLTMVVATEAIVKGKDVATAVNEACGVLRKYQGEVDLPPLPLRPNPWGNCESVR
jgi:ABC-type glycerol-3-phosphate transport system substrate-binding protein